jgi:hypothetical protein
LPLTPLKVLFEKKHLKNPQKLSNISIPFKNPYSKFLKGGKGGTSFKKFPPRSSLSQLIAGLCPTPHLRCFLKKAP